MKNKDYYSEVVLQNFLVPPNTYQYVNNTSILTIGTVSEPKLRDRWAGGVLAPDGKIYCIPKSSSFVLVIDPIKRTTSSFRIPNSYPASEYVIAFPSLMYHRWSGGVLAPNGKIYCIPYNASEVLEIDPIERKSSIFGASASPFNTPVCRCSYLHYRLVFP